MIAYHAIMGNLIMIAKRGGRRRAVIAAPGRRADGRTGGKPDGGRASAPRGGLRRARAGGD